jgi:hypothetical protein
MYTSRPRRAEPRCSVISCGVRLRVAFCLGVVTALAALGHGCYDVPSPDCGFACGAGGACPDGYHCASNERRCHRNGSPDTLTCPSAIDAGTIAGDAPGD